MPLFCPTSQTAALEHSRLRALAAKMRSCHRPRDARACLPISSIASGCWLQTQRLVLAPLVYRAWGCFSGFLLDAPPVTPATTPLGAFRLADSDRVAP